MGLGILPATRFRMALFESIRMFKDLPSCLPVLMASRTALVFASPMSRPFMAVRSISLPRWSTANAVEFRFAPVLASMLTVLLWC